MQRRRAATHASVSLTLLALSLMACAGVPPRGSTPRPARAGTVDSFQVDIPELGNRPRTVRVYLPPSYADGTAAFPVLYLQDGQNLFAPGAYGDWQIDETLDRMVDTGRSAGLIVVGIDNGAQRWSEYGPWVNHHMRAWVDSSWGRPTEGGEGDAYVRFLANTLKPRIDRRYRTLADRAHTAIGGSSMGGLIALYAGLTRPDVFSKVLAMSTAVWFAEDGGPWLSNNRLLAMLRDRPVPRSVRFYLDVGTSERSRAAEPDVVDARGTPVSYARAYREGTERVVEALRDGGVAESNLRLVVEQDAIHHESAWARRFGAAVTWLFE
jgi:predicted alpha/beta superfamily hydrolase